jgi:DNA (cytosine-5)-methyltransferase 1
MPRLLDLFCGAGGAAMGYARAGFDVVGVDLEPQPRYPFTHHVWDALEWAEKFGDQFDAIHASPPCQRYCTLTPKNAREAHPDLVEATRALLKKLGKHYVIENVNGAPLARGSFKLCGSSFGLDVRRHRFFETNWLCLGAPPCHHSRQLPRFKSADKRAKTLARVVCVVGGGHFSGDTLKVRSDAMGIDWMQGKELTQAIPPAYTEWIGKRLLRVTSPSPSPA